MGYTHDIELMSVMTDFEIIGFRHQIQFPGTRRQTNRDLREGLGWAELRLD